MKGPHERWRGRVVWRWLTAGGLVAGALAASGCSRPASVAQHSARVEWERIEMRHPAWDRLAALDARIAEVRREEGEAWIASRRPAPDLPPVGALETVLAADLEEARTR